MSLTLGGTNPAVTFPDGTVQNTSANLTAPYTANGVVYASSTSALATGSAFQFDGTKVIAQGVNFAYYTGLYANDGTISNYSSSNGVYLNGNAGGWLSLSGDGSQYNNIRIYGQSASSPNIITFNTNNTEQMRLTSTGLGIGTSSPATKLHIKDSTNTTLTIQGDASAGASFINFSADTGNQTKAQISGSKYGANGGNLIFSTLNSGTVTEAARIDSSGRLLINSTTPDATSGISGAKLQVLGGIVAGIDGLGSGGTGYIAFNSAMASAPTSAHPIIYHRQGVGLGLQSDYAISFAINGSTEAARIDSSGNLGLGVTPSAWISTFKAIQIGNGASVQGQTNSVSVVHVSGNAYVDSGGTYRYIGTGEAAQRYQQYLGAHSWYIAPSGTAGNAISFTQAMTLSNAGVLSLGSTSTVAFSFSGVAFNGSSYNGFGLNDTASASGAGYIYFQSNGTTIGSIARVGATSAVVYNTTSDQRLKTNIADALPVLDKLMSVKVRQYDWTEGNLHQDYGFVAQEIEPVLSGIVTKGKTEEDMWQLDYSRLTPYLVKAIQELSAKVTALEAKLGV